MFRSYRSTFPAHAISVEPGRMVVVTATAIAFLAFFSARPAAAQATIEYGHVATGSSAGLNGLGKKINSSLSPGEKPASAQASRKRGAGATGADNVPEYNPREAQEANRRALEQHAGPDAAKLNFKSAPANAVVSIDGKPVGETPLLMSLAPGTYQVEMEGPRMEFGKQRLTVGAKETRDIDLHLSAAPRYPTHITLK
jgi:PEGA domain